MKNGEIAMVVGTHALISKWVRFKDLGLVIIDEQHRFGTKQRQALREKEERLPHLLSMTATPIPRSLALTLYGDLDLSVLSELPKGRKPVTTKVVYPAGRNAVYEEVRERLKAGEQAYVICPRIDDPDPDQEQALIARSAVAEAKRLAETIFPEYEIGVVHGKLSSKARDEVMERFAAGSVNILVATSVIEVGVNVPDATVIIIEGAERFGLAQLHQLRGRVMRSSKPPLCFLFPESSGEAAVTRLEALRTAKNGFELAEADLVQRGAGALSGSKQWGITDLGMESLQNLRLVEAAREHARRIVDNDASLESYPALSSAMAARGKDIHFE
jgi:ATP-dependent DNA helicase RecG